MANKNVTSQLPIEILDEMFQFAELKQSFKLQEKRDLSTKPSNIDTKFFDLVMAEYNGFDLHKKKEFKKHIYDWLSG
uniref:Uncharacterized protein n=1 Tax=Ditylenchus dipsaci TaxID=166011 RepID=A0A915E5B9_9BILA